MANNHHPLLADLVQAMREEEKNEKEQDTHTEREITMSNRDAARQHLLNIVTGQTQENRIDAITKILKLSDSSITREDVVRVTSRPSPAQQLAELADVEIRER